MPKYQDYLFSAKDGKQHQKTRIQLMEEVEAVTKRRLIVYAADFKKGNPLVPPTIEPEDKTGFSDLIEGLEDQPLDILIHSPGGSVEAVEQLVSMLRANFGDIRFIVPDRAMSAATLMCLAGDSILMDERSFLGPIDPQIQITFPDGGSVRLPAQTIMDGFDRAQEAISKDETAFRVFLPWLDRFGPFVQVCQNAMDLSIELATKWLAQYMLKARENAQKQAVDIAAYLSDHNLHKSHARPISISDATEKGLQIIDLRSQPDLRELIHKLWAAIDLYFERSASVKIFESAHGVHWGRILQTQEVQIALPSPFKAPPVVPQVEQPPPREPKKETSKRKRRRKKK